MKVDEQRCRAVVAALRMGESFASVARRYAVSKSTIADWKSRIGANGRYRGTCRQRTTRRAKAVSAVYCLPLLENGNTKANVKVQANGSVKYRFVPQSHRGWGECGSSEDVKRALRLNRSAFSAAHKAHKLPSARTVRRHRQQQCHYSLESGPKMRKNWLAPVHFARSVSQK